MIFFYIRINDIFFEIVIFRVLFKNELELRFLFCVYFMIKNVIFFSFSLDFIYNFSKMLFL